MEIQNQNGIIMRIIIFIISLITSILKYFDPIFTSPSEEATILQNSIEKFGNSPNFFKGSFKEASLNAKSQFKFLLVYFHSRIHQDTEIFCRNVLANPTFIEFVDQHFVIWGGDVHFSHAQMVSYQLGITKYPFLGMYYQENASAHSGRFIYIFDTHQSCDELIVNISNALEQYGGILVADRSDHEEAIRNRQLREEQERAYLESVERDRERERQRIERENERKRKEEEEKRQLMEIQNLEKTLPSEPEENESKVTRIAIRLRDGTKIERRFRESESTDILYKFVISKECTTNIELLSGFPTKVIERSESITLKEADLAPKALIISQEPF